MIYYNNYEIFQYIIKHPAFFKNLFIKFFDDIKNSIGFLNEFILIVKAFYKYFIY